MHAFFFALSFLTRLPVPATTFPVTPELQGRAALFYPVVGALLGGLLVGLEWLLPNVAPVQAAVLLTAWTLLTGALHLDGLADSADAWLGGFGDKDRTLRILKDPNCGPAGVTAIGLVLLLKFAALDAGVSMAVLWFAPITGRAAALCLLMTTPYARSGGLGEAAAHHMPRRFGYAVLAGTIALWLGWRTWNGVALLGGVVILNILLRRLMLRRLGGCTGDTLGAAVELSEAAFVTLGALCSDANSPMI